MSTRPKICWSDLSNGAVGLWGLGVEGGANLRRLMAMGTVPVLVDDHPRSSEVDGIPVLPSAEGGVEALERCDVVVKTPGISRYREEVRQLVRQGIPVVGGMGLWLEQVDRRRVVCITGTKGKSTTTAIVGHLLNALGYRCLIAGNIGRLPYDPDVDTNYDYWAVETSSFQATDLSSSPPVVAVTSLHPDHLDWHRTTTNYFCDKLSACTQPGADLTIADGTSVDLRARRSLLGPRVEWVEPDLPANGGTGDRSWWSNLDLVGAHNVRNAMIARACLVALGVREAQDEEALGQASIGFEGLESRLRPIGSVGGVEFIDDSLSTNVLATLAALDTFDRRPVALIVGGQDRGIEYEELASALAIRQQPTLVLTLPDSGPRIHAAIRHHGGPTGEVVDCPDLDAAVRIAFTWSETGGVVLLSPAAPSFGQFKNYEERAAAFAAAMRTCDRS